VGSRYISQLDASTIFWIISGRKYVSGKPVDPLHNKSKELRRGVAKIMKKVYALNAKKKEAADNAACDQAEALWEKCKEHAVQTNYGHYVQLQIGSMSFYSALLKMLSPKSKRPRGKLEFVFNNAIEHRCMHCCVFLGESTS